MPTVTVLIPVYNGAEYIREAVTCVLGQQEVDVELIVIDDGSTDATPAILAEFGDSIRVLKQQNAGHVKARNNGAKLAQGEWLAFLDADDLWTPDKLAKQLALADENVGLIYTNRRNFGEIGRIDELASDYTTLHEGNIFEPLLFGNFVTVSSALMRKTAFEQHGGFFDELRVCEDWDLWMRFSAAGGITRVCREPLTLYRWQSTSMQMNHPRMAAGRLFVLRRALETPRGRAIPWTTRAKALSSVWKCSAWYAAPTLRGKALWWYMRSALYWPADTSVYKGMAKCVLGRT